MTIKATKLLKLFSKAEKLDLSVAVREDKDGDYVIRIFAMFSPKNFDKTLVLNQSGGSDWNGDYDFGAMMDVLDEKLEEQKQKEIKEQKRQELLARLTSEEKELLGVK